MPIFTTQINFNDTNRDKNGRHRVGGLIGDAAGDLAGMPAMGGANGDGTVFDIPSIDGSDAGTPASFDTNGAYPDAGLIAGAAGDLSGTTIGIIANTDTDAAAAIATDRTATVANAAGPPLTTLASFNGANGESPYAGLITDAAGNLFGTTAFGGSNGDGTVFELVNNGGGSYTQTTLVGFNGTDGANPFAGLIADAAGDLFGTTYYGACGAKTSVAVRTRSAALGLATLSRACRDHRPR
jgi:uncharacterized repeat protein (TIGR03803 family)